MSWLQWSDIIWPWLYRHYWIKTNKKFQSDGLKWSTKLLNWQILPFSSFEKFAILVSLLWNKPNKNLLAHLKQDRQELPNCQCLILTTVATVDSCLLLNISTSVATVEPCSSVQKISAFSHKISWPQWPQSKPVWLLYISASEATAETCSTLQKISAFSQKISWPQSNPVWLLNISASEATAETCSTVQKTLPSHIKYLDHSGHSWNLFNCLISQPQRLQLKPVQLFKKSTFLA